MTAEGTFPKIPGDVLYASEVNEFGRIHRKLFTDNAQYSQLGATFVDKITFNFSGGSGCVITNFYLKGKMKTTLAGTASAGAAIRVSGTNLGTLYLSNMHGNFIPEYWDTSVNSNDWIMYSSEASYETVGISIAAPIKILDNSTSIIVSLGTNNGGAEGFLSGTSLDIIYTKSAVED